MLKSAIALVIAGLIANSTPTYIGEYECTAYAEDTITATGTTPRHMKTVAVDPNVIPYGSELYIADLGLFVKAEDCGGAVKGNVIDIFMSGSEADTEFFGRQVHSVFLLP